MVVVVAVVVCAVYQFPPERIVSSRTHLAFESKEEEGLGLGAVPRETWPLAESTCVPYSLVPINVVVAPRPSSSRGNPQCDRPNPLPQFQQDLSPPIAWRFAVAISPSPTVGPWSMPHSHSSQLDSAVLVVVVHLDDADDHVVVVVVAAFAFVVVAFGDSLLV